MHHPGLLLLILLLAVLFGPLFLQGMSAMGDMVGPLVLSLPGVAALSKMAAPTFVLVLAMLGVAVIGLLKLVAGI